jgi:glycosyltransferase involved in cell wall biosynthesis/acetyltransferase-like isoleucine patch superfamily enzyme
VSPHELYAKARGRVQTFRFVWRVRIRARLAGGRARVFVRRTNPFDLSRRHRRPLRRIERGVRLSVTRGATVQLYLGDRISIGAGTSLRLGSEPVYLGDGCRIEPGSTVDAAGPVVLRERATFGPGSSLLARGAEVLVHPHAAVGPNGAVVSADSAATVIGRGARLGPGATAAPGARLGPGAAVDPAGVAAGDVPGPRPGGRGLLVSVVVSTKDRAGMLPRLFESLEAQTLPPSRFEVVIVDNGSSDDTLRWLRSRARRTPFRTSVLRREPPGGPARGRNAGWRAARAAVVAFTDDDCAPSPEWLEVGAAAFEGRDRLAIAQGRTDPEPRQIAGLRGLAASQRIEWESGLYETCNLFVRREALVAAGGFAEDIPVPAAEDTELAWKVKGLGGQSVFVRDAVVYHAVHPGRLRDYERRFAQWSEVHRTLRRTPEVRRGFFLGHFWTRHHAWFLLFLAGLIAWVALTATGATPRWPALIPMAPYLGFLLRNSRETLSLWERIAYAPVRLVADVIEVTTLARGSIRHRALLL